MDPYKKHFNKMKKNKVVDPKSRPRFKNKKSKKRKNKSFPVGAIFYSILICCGMTYCLKNLEQIENKLSKISINLFSTSKAQSASGQEKNKLDKSSDKADSSTVLKSELAVGREGAVKKDINYFRMLEKKEDVLKEKEEKLKKLEANLQLQRDELVGKIQELEQIRADISLALKDKVDTDKNTVDKLVQVYANMKPKSAAKVLETMKVELAVKILHNMKKKSAAAILNVIKSGRAKHLTEKIAGYEE